MMLPSVPSELRLYFSLMHDTPVWLKYPLNLKPTRVLVKGSAVGLYISSAVLIPEPRRLTSGDLLALLDFKRMLLPDRYGS